MKRVSLVFIVILLVAVGATLVYIFSSRGGATFSRSIQTTPSGLRASFNQHLLNLENYTSALYSDYADNATVVWTGRTAGLGGTYVGANNLRLLYDAALLSVHNLSLTLTGYTEVVNSSSKATVVTGFNISGRSNFLGPFNGSIQASLTYQFERGAWKIVNENWNFVQFSVSSGGGATTFPEWQKLGGPLESRRSADWFHNFVWDYGGAAIAILVYACTGTLMALFLSKLYRRHS